ncbi:MAG: hypothetical protein RMK29_00230 [Myxococcales bacterium]|nr:MFS transporter [Myxococcota bacterium]MDW8280102.1 hypothetical protein [Myxococcales bacterium]
MPETADGRSVRYHWAQGGDVSAFLGLASDNVAQLIVFATLLIQVFGYPADLVLQRMVPGTALGVLLGDLLYTWMAFRLARRTGRSDVTAMPLGIDTPSLFGLTLGVLGPLHQATGDPVLSWQAGMALMVCMGVCKIVLSFVAAPLARLLPGAALLGTIGAIGVLLIAFFPTLKVLSLPLVGLPTLLVGLLALLRPPRMPLGIPPILLVVLLGTGLFYAAAALGLVPGHARSVPALTLAVPWPTLSFARGMEAALPYLPVALPLALVTVIGGIDVTASAAAAGDAYSTRNVLLTEGVSTLLAGLCGGVIQTTPYIGHPAYKRMGGRAAYTLATALFVGLGGVLGLLGLLVHAVPEVVLAPILVFIGIEIAAQAFLSVPARHAPAVAAAFLPVVAHLALLLLGQVLPGTGSGAPTGAARTTMQTLTLLSSGFVLSSLLWGACVAYSIDGRLAQAAAALLACGLGALFGLVHSPLPSGATFLPWRLPDRTPWLTAGGYLVAAILLLLALPVVKKADDAAAGPPGPGHDKPATTA